MGPNTYKKSQSMGWFSRVKQVIHFEYLTLHGLPSRYVSRLLFLFCLGILYVGNTHYHEKMARKIDRLEQDIEALRVEYTTLQADYMFDSKQSEVAKKVAHLGLYESSYPPDKVTCK